MLYLTFFGDRPSLGAQRTALPAPSSTLFFYDDRYPVAMNLVHHNPVDWNTTITHIKEALEKECNISLPFIPYQEWMERLGKVSGSTSSEEMNRIVRIFTSLCIGTKGL